jgi:hypothetical protein
MKQLTTPTTEQADDELFTTIEAAKLLRLRPNTLEIWRWSGKGPRFLKLGRACRYRRSDLEKFKNDAVRTSTTQQMGA